MKNPKFYNSNGTLTKYALFCGYVEKQETEIGKKQMYVEYNHIHVKHHIKTDVSVIQQEWNTFGADELTKARKFYNSIKV